MFGNSSPRTEHASLRQEIPLSHVIDRFCHFITVLRILRHVSTRKKPPRSCIFPTYHGLFGLERAGDRWSRETFHDGVESLVREVSSINNNALSALASANPAAISITTRKLVTNDSAIAIDGARPAGR